MNLEEENTLIEAYLNGGLPDSKLQAFEERLLDDARFRESVLLQKQLYEALDDNSWSFAKNVDPETVKSYEAEFRSQETKDLAANLKKVNAKYQAEKPQKKINFKPWLFYMSAAIIAVLIAVNGLMPTSHTPEQLYVDYYEAKDLPSLVVRGENEVQLVIAQQHFEGGNYAQALPIFNEQLANNSPQKATLYVYKGITEMELKHYEAAAQTFNTLSNSNLLDASKGLWYSALLQLKQGNVPEAKIVLKKIVASPTNYKFKDAKSLLGEL